MAIAAPPALRAIHTHTVVALLEDRPGVLNRVVSLFRRRGFNIETLTVGHTDLPDISRLTVVVEGDDRIVEQVVKQLYKVIEVLKVSDVTADRVVTRELALIKVATGGTTRSEIMQICDIFRAKIVDVASDSLMIEVTGTQDKVESLVQLVRRFGIKELVRTGRVAMVRGSQGVTRVDDE
ncbi:MAG: acetolactate synthase small subunit [Chloroflexi bacterium]|nr:acetolactate synthase small subunit [Chloroflexota bacterium]MBI4504653.1 acetolactate synthase small subunit [Chloroflexota bacterium]